MKMNPGTCQGCHMNTANSWPGLLAFFYCWFSPALISYKLLNFSTIFYGLDGVNEDQTIVLLHLYLFLSFVSVNSQLFPF